MKTILRLILTCIAMTFVFSTFSEKQCFARNITLAWDENKENDLAGYRIYYRIGSSGQGILNDYTGTGIAEGDSPITVPLGEDENSSTSSFEFSLRNLRGNENYFFVVTAYDTQDLESGPSNEAVLLKLSTAPFIMLLLD